MIKPIVLLLTFNVAGVPLIYPSWPARRTAIAQTLKNSSYDLVALQEVWRESDAQALFEESAMPYRARAPSHSLIGDGLLILSRFRILETRHLIFRCKPPGLTILHRGELLAQKGALMARVKTPWGELDVYNTHLVADYPSVKNLATRRAQIFELSQMMQEFSVGRPVILMGDINSGPGDREYAMLRELLDLQDPCLAGRRERCGFSYPGEAKRLDHILLPAGRINVETRLAFTERLPGTPIPYSDHKAVRAELRPGVMSLRLSPNPKSRRWVLRQMETRFEEVLDSWVARIRSRDWIPLYGTFHEAIYHPQIRNLKKLRERIKTALRGETQA